MNMLNKSVCLGLYIFKIVGVAQSISHKVGVTIYIKVGVGKTMYIHACLLVSERVDMLSWLVFSNNKVGMTNTNSQESRLLIEC